ncbi:hypothetical protein RA350_004439, partial [Salmonella enterica]|nr:hypothetical protein [Salmonella enterica]
VRPALVFSQPYFTTFSSILKNMGLGIQFIITEKGKSATFTWDEIQKIANGNELRKEFGEVLPSGISDHNATIKMDFLYTTEYKESSSVTNIGGAINVMNINPTNAAPKENGFNLSPFNVRILRRGLGKVDITPSLVNLGHFYTSDKSSPSKQANFMVTARQVLRPAPGQAFTLPLQVTFGTGALSPSDNGQALNLVNMDNSTPNGLQLSVKESSTGSPITFDKKEELGDISINSQLSGMVSKTYTAEVKPAPGATVQTGKFSAAIPVTVTYN